VAAITAVAAFSYIAFQVLAANEGGIAIVRGRIEQARLSAAADAGIAMAIHGLGDEDRGARWSIDGRARELDFDGVSLNVVVEDERGKAPLAGLNDPQARVLFQGAGASGDRLDALVAEFRDWQTEDTTVPPPPPPPGPPIRHGPIRTIGELAALKDMTPDIFAQVAPAVTVFFEESGGFNVADAQPLAVATMSELSVEGPDQLAGDSLFANERPVEVIAPDDHYIAHTLTVKVIARDRNGAHTHRMAIIELTGDKAKPFWVRYVE